MNQQIATPLNKISVKTVFGPIPVQAVKEEGKDVLRLPIAIGIMRVMGQATEFEIKESDFGPSFKFKGIFRATNLDTGELFESTACFLPEIVSEGLAKALESSSGAAEFAFDIGAIPAKNAHGYEYRVKPLIAAVESPVFAQLEAKIGGLPQLASPASTSDTGEKKPAGKAKK